jgi:23S rRNA pseudouridine1911/1915/1917 synthase
MRLDLYTSHKLRISRSYAKNLIKKGKILADGKILSNPDFEIKSEVHIKFNNPVPVINILYDHREFLIVNKPYNMSVCRSSTTPKAEFVLNELLLKKYDLCESEKRHEFGLVNRIDKLTEGIIILSKSTKAYLHFKNLFRERKIKKYYRAYYKGISCEKIYSELSFKYFICKHGVHNFSLEKDCFCENDFKLHECVLMDSSTERNCITGLKVEEDYFLCHLVTGRTHQIRKIMKIIGQPVWGDPEYGIEKDRMLLFSTALSIRQEDFLEN